MSETRAHAVAVTSTSTPPGDVDVDLLFIPVFQDGDTLDDLPGVAEATGGEWTRARESGEFRARRHEVFVTRVVNPAWKARRLAFIGVGPRAGVDAGRMRRVAAVCGYTARQRAANSAGVVVRYADVLAGATATADGLAAAEFDAGIYKRAEDRPAPSPSRLVIVVPGADEGTAAEAVHRGRVIGEAANVARALANEPGNVLTPREFASRVAEVARQVGLPVEILGQARLRELGMRLLLGVAQGSAEPPHFIVLRYDPPGAPATPVVAFVGKGVTFDSGGISIKPAEGMERMKNDMAGGAAVAAAMRALALLKSPYRAIGLIPTVENMPGGRAVRPGDVLTGASGTSVEIINTDAEGRLILADALWYAQQLGATHLVDVATLTGACLVALGRHVSGLFGAPESWVETVRNAGQRAGDRLWPMPIYDEAREELQSEIADLINSAGRAGGAITAAAFLREFSGGLPWAHLDIAGTAWADSRKPHQPKGATGVAVRTLIELGLTGGSSRP